MFILGANPYRATLQLYVIDKADLVYSKRVLELTLEL